MDAAPLVAIVGTGRNGSTLIGRLLDGSPELWVHPGELNYLAVWDELARSGTVTGPTVQNRTTRPLTGLGTDISLTRLLAIYEPQWREIERDYVARLAEPLQARRPELDGGRETWSVEDFLPAFLDATRRAYGGSAQRLLAFKTIETPYVYDYARVFPGIRFVHILRDPLTTYESLKRTRTEHKQLPFYADGDHLQTFLGARWIPHADAILRGLEFDPDHHFLVRYEDLRAQPAVTIGAVCAWLGVTAPAEPDRQTALGGRHLSELPSNPSTPGIATPERVVSDMAARFGYQDALTTRERALITRCTAPLAERLGYARLRSRPRALTLWLSWLVPDSDERRHRRSRLRWAWEIARRRAYITRILLHESRKLGA